MNLPQFLLKKHLIFDVETFGLSGDVFAFGAVLGRFELSSDGEHATWFELVNLAATAREFRLPWTFNLSTPEMGRAYGGTLRDPGKRCRPEDFAWLQANIPDGVFASERLTGDLSLHQLFDALARPHLGSVELWAECPVPCEATFLRELAQVVGAPWGTTKIPPLRDIASLADALRIDEDRSDNNKPAHDPLNDARHSAQRLSSAVNKLLRLSES